MDNLTIFRGAVLSTLSFLIIAIITPIATIAIDFLYAADGKEVLEFVCVWCQYGATDNNPNGTSTILNITSFDFYNLWIPILVLILLTLIPLFKSFPETKLGQKFKDGFALSMLWGIAVASLIIRALLSFLIRIREAEYQEMYPDIYVKGELGWGAAALIFAAISAVSAAMIGFIEFQYELEENQEPSQTPSTS